MSIDLVSAALWLPFDSTRKLVLVALCDRADQTTGFCYPGRDYIAARASLSVRRVSPHLSSLEELGYIKRRRRGDNRIVRTTATWVNVDRILKEGRERQDAFREDQRSRYETLAWNDDQAELPLFDTEDYDDDLPM